MGAAALHLPPCIGSRRVLLWPAFPTHLPAPPPAVNRKDRDERRAVRTELRQLGKEERKRQEKAVEEVLSGAQVRRRWGGVGGVRVWSALPKTSAGGQRTCGAVPLSLCQPVALPPLPLLPRPSQTGHLQHADRRGQPPAGAPAV